jgi:hypothetical protein
VGKILVPYSHRITSSGTVQFSQRAHRPHPISAYNGGPPVGRRLAVPEAHEAGSRAPDQ